MVSLGRCHSDRLKMPGDDQPKARARFSGHNRAVRPPRTILGPATAMFSGNRRRGPTPYFIDGFRSLALFSTDSKRDSGFVPKSSHSQTLPPRVFGGLGWAGPRDAPLALSSALLAPLLPESRLQALLILETPAAFAICFLRSVVDRGSSVVPFQPAPSVRQRKVFANQASVDLSAQRHDDSEHRSLYI